MTEKTICISCKTNIVNQSGSVTFSCPQCGKYTLTRCKHCREIAALYVCPSCNFEGPN